MFTDSNIEMLLKISIFSVLFIYIIENSEYDIWVFLCETINYL